MRTRLRARQVCAILRGGTAVQTYPDGEVARVRAIEVPTVDGLRTLQRRWENRQRRRRCLAECARL